MSRARRLRIGSMYLAILMLVFTGCDIRQTVAASNDSEQIRVTSPNGQLDAVLVRIDGGGAAGGWEWYAFIALKNKAVDIRSARPLFNAGTLAGCRLVWAHPNLLEIHYDVASINDFRNVWALTEVQSGGEGAKNNYFVEVKLVPTSEFSILTPDGDFRRK